MSPDQWFADSYLLYRHKLEVKPVCYLSHLCKSVKIMNLHIFKISFSHICQLLVWILHIHSQHELLSLPTQAGLGQDTREEQLE